MTTTSSKTFIRQYQPLTQVLDQDLARWVTMYEKRSQKDPKTYGAVHELIKDFQAFAEDYVTGLSNLLDKMLPSRIPQEEHERFKNAYRYTLATRLIAEWNAISAVLEQRELERYQTWLAKVDAEAHGTFAPAIVASMGPATTLRHMPYSNISIASVPRETYLDMNETRMALGHEVGHHVWRVTFFDNLDDTRVGQGQLGNFVRTLFAGDRPELAGLLTPWLEEMFADVYGALKLGRPFVESMISSLKERVRSRVDLLMNDGEHPIPYLRPLLRIRAIQIAGLPNQDTNDLLVAWRDFTAKVLKSDDDQLLDFETLSPQIPRESETPSRRRPIVKSATTESIFIDDVQTSIINQHDHTLVYHQVRLDDLEAAVDRVIKELLIPLVQSPHPPADDYFSYYWLENRFLPLFKKRFNITLEDIDVLLLPLSTLLGTVTVGTGSGGGKTTHDHDNLPRHTHNPDNTVTIAA